MIIEFLQKEQMLSMIREEFYIDAVPGIHNGTKIFIASDHAGVNLKKALVCWLNNQGVAVSDLGCHESAINVDYPDYAFRLTEAMTPLDGSKRESGILVCRSGCGMCMSANKHPGIRAGMCITPKMAKSARAHNDINVLCLGQEFVDLETAIEITLSFLTTEFLGGRHARRLLKIHNRHFANPSSSKIQEEEDH